MNNEDNARLVRLSWDEGTAYDLFVSLIVLNNPDTYNLRPSWAAGVRSRLPADERRLLEGVSTFIWVPFSWVNRLPEPKDAASVLWALRQTPARERMLNLLPCHKENIQQAFRKIADAGSWDRSDLERVKTLVGEKKYHMDVKQLSSYLDWWAHPDEFGELYLSALTSYYQAFFADEEKRIAPLLRQAVDQSAPLAERLSVSDLLTELSQGVHFDHPFDVEEIVLVPSFWSTPLVLWGSVSETKMIFIFGARPPSISLVPGEAVPDGLLRVLNATADPTRLQILRLLSQQKLSPAQLARSLRLRAPTVTHHLSTLRLAGLVHLTLGANDERLYAARMEAVKGILDSLEQFLNSGKETQ